LAELAARFSKFELKSASSVTREPRRELG